MRKQKAVLWVRSAEPNKFGKYSYEAPVEIDCRWDGSGKEFRDSKGQTVFSDSVVYVDRVVKIGDMLREGEMASDEPEDPTTIETTAEVRRFDTTPDFRAKETLLTAYL